MNDRSVLDAAWKKRTEMMAEAKKLMNEANRLMAKSDWLLSAGVELFNNAVEAECGDVDIWWRCGECTVGNMIFKEEE